MRWRAGEGVNSVGSRAHPVPLGCVVRTLAISREAFCLLPMRSGIRGIPRHSFATAHSIALSHHLSFRPFVDIVLRDSMLCLRSRMVVAERHSAHTSLVRHSSMAHRGFPATGKQSPACHPPTARQHGPSATPEHPRRRALSTCHARSTREHACHTPSSNEYARHAPGPHAAR
jgi:hypothetical protein